MAIVVDPLRSLAKGVPELKAFRAYPPEYTNPVQNQCPNGEIIHEEQARLEQWGSCWQAYYELDVEYFMSGGARSVLSTLTQNFLWMRTLGSTPMCETEARDRYPDRVGKAAERLKKYQPTNGSGGGGGVGDMPSAMTRGGRGGGGGAPKVGGGSRSEAGGDKSGKQPSSSTGTSSEGKDDEDGGELGKSCQAVIEIATEKLVGNIAQVAKRELFS